MQLEPVKARLEVDLNSNLPFTVCIKLHFWTLYGHFEFKSEMPKTADNGDSISATKKQEQKNPKKILGSN